MWILFLFTDFRIVFFLLDVRSLFGKATLILFLQKKLLLVLLADLKLKFIKTQVQNIQILFQIRFQNLEIVSFLKSHQNCLLFLSVCRTNHQLLFYKLVFKELLDLFRLILLNISQI